MELKVNIVRLSIRNVLPHCAVDQRDLQFSETSDNAAICPLSLKCVGSNNINPEISDNEVICSHNSPSRGSNSINPEISYNEVNCPHNSPSAGSNSTTC